MKKTSYSDALSTALAILATETPTNDEEREALNGTMESLSRLRDSIAKRNAHKASDEAKAKVSAKRKEQTSEARKALVAQVAPIVRNAMNGTDPMTAKDIFAKCEGLPEDFTSAKVQYLLLHEMANEVTKIEAKGKANTYALLS